MYFGANVVQPSTSPKWSKYHTGWPTSTWLLPSGNTLQRKAATARDPVEPRGKLSVRRLGE